MSRRYVLAILVTFTFVLAACSDDDDSSSNDSDDSPTTTEASSDAGDGDVSPSETESETETETTTVDQFDFTGFPPPSNRIISGGPKGKIDALVACNDDGTGTVMVTLSNGTPGEIVVVQLGSDVHETTLDADGAGELSVDGEVADPTPIAAIFAESTQRGRITGC